MAGSILQMSTTPISKVPGNMIEQKSSLIDSPVPKQHQQPEQPPVSVESLGYSFTDTEPSKLSVQSPKGIPQQGKWAIPVDRSHSPTPQQWATQSLGIPAFGQQGQTTNLLGEYQHHVYCGPATTWLFGSTGGGLSAQSTPVVSMSRITVQ